MVKKVRKIIFVFLTIIIVLGMTVSVNAEIGLNKTDITIIQGKSTHLKILGTNKKVKWTSNKPAIAVVDSKGFVTGYKKGVAVITATIGRNKYTCTATVKPLTINNVKALTFNELLHLIEKKVISENKLIALIKGDSLSESVIIKLIKKEYVSEAKVLELIKENGLSQAGILQLVKDHTLSKEDIIELIKSNTLTEERVRQIVAAYSGGGLSASEVIDLINQYAPLAGTKWSDGTDLKFADKFYHIGDSISIKSYYNGSYHFLNYILTGISIKKYHVENDVNYTGRYKYVVEMTGSFDMDEIGAFRNLKNDPSYIPGGSVSLNYFRKDGMSEITRLYDFGGMSTSPASIVDINYDFNESTGNFKVVAIQKNSNVDYDCFSISEIH